MSILTTRRESAAGSKRAHAFGPKASKSIPRLEQGARLSAEEFLRRYDAMPEVKKAELINGVVYMGSPVRVPQHAGPDGLMQGILAIYAFAVPGCQNLPNATTRLGPVDIPQPDSMLRWLPEHGGETQLDAKGYLHGAPDLVVEIAADKSAFDASGKLEAFRKAGVPECVVWFTGADTINWLALENNQYYKLLPDAKGIIRSRIFPGMWLDVNALFAEDRIKIESVLRRGIKHARQAKLI